MEVLIVDSDGNAAAHMAGVISAWGHRVKTADANNTALALVAGKKFDVVLLDVSPSAGQGRELLAGLRELQPQAGIVALNGDEFYNPELETSLRKYGILYYTIKPPAPSALLDTVLDHLFIRIGLLLRPAS